MGDDDIEQYLQEIGRFRLLAEDEEVAIARRIAKGDAAAREEMIQCNLRLVVSIAKGYANCGLMLLDVIAEGNLGLMKAVERFNPECGRRFSTYASWWIKQTIRRALSSKVKNVRVPTYMAEMVSRWKRVSAELTQVFQRAVTPEEIAREMRLNEERVGVVRQALGASYSLSLSSLARGCEAEEELDARVSRLGGRRDANIIDSASDEAKLLLLASCLGRREERIFLMRYGLGQGQNDALTLDEIGATFSPPLTRERVRQLEIAALHTMLRILDEEERTT